ncbi:LysR family transcriptional regulator [Tardiphaga robiniae]|uniref:LysR family transcriptional regulator n=1 Tax=Tardiphaga robiniae TaxID=943830 RepID=UPI001FCDDCDE|nr:LysR family transcriptional regulator [Tardiphaga robiniae]
MKRFLQELIRRQLRAGTVHRDRSVTAAAKKMHLRQPAVTLQIRNLQTLAGR